MTSSLPPTVAAHVPTGLLVGGGWRPASGGATFPVHDPGTTEVLFDVAAGVVARFVRVDEVHCQ
ncbi:MAG: NAD-dependent succinate-semialdehyde dehydrogenase, partial [Cellulomonas sp.]|nr:NAD-dependent succinate-semialdehyde dehydrogenase [Cellulomonas sp.]